MAFIIITVLLCSCLFYTPAAYSEEIAANYGPSCTSETPHGKVWMGDNGGICDELLTIFEKLKLSNLDNGLASQDLSPSSKSSSSRGLLATASGVAAAIITLACIIAYEMNKQRVTDGARRHLLEELHRFSLDEIRSATKNFSPASFIRQERSGEVYGGLIDNGERTVAIKRLSRYSLQGAPVFWNEVEALSKLRHANLVSLIGYCNESREMILVYEFMPLGTLADNLYINNSLPWEQRLRICIGAARGLDYLHTGTDHRVIHGDLKSSSILLDEKFKAKISDFGLTKIGEAVQLPHSHVEGTPGEMAAADHTSQQLLEKSDVYSIGVVLLEVLCGRRAADSRDQQNQPELISWARGLIHNGHIDQIADSRLYGQISPNCLKAFVGISEKCLHDDPRKRPTMVQLVAQLELLLDNHVLGENNAEMVQDLAVPERKKLRLEASVIVAQPHIVEPSRRSEELTFPDGRFRCFSISDIVTATGNFSNDSILYNGLYGIYKGAYLPRSKAASHVIYKGKSMPDISKLKELSHLDHPTLASMVGYCCSDGEMMIVYEHDGGGILLRHLNRHDLPWKHRLSICIDAAKALRYLHMVKIIHGGISPTTIVLDWKLGAKLVTFGSILSSSSASNAGKLGHLPPDFAGSTKLTEKSDVYLFGLLLLVVFCGGKTCYSGAYPLLLPRKVSKAIKTNTLYQITDLNLKDVAEKCLSKFLEVALSCLSPKQVDRPSMDTVLAGLKKAQALQI